MRRALGELTRARGSAFRLLATAQAGANLAASAVAGILWTAVSPVAAFVFLGAAMIVSVQLILTSRSRRTTGSPPPSLPRPPPQAPSSG